MVLKNTLQTKKPHTFLQLILQYDTAADTFYVQVNNDTTALHVLYSECHMELGPRFYIILDLSGFQSLADSIYNKRKYLFEHSWSPPFTKRGLKILKIT